MIKYHVEVYPKAKVDFESVFSGRPHYTAEDEKDICEKIRLDILRHVDNVEGIWVVEEKED